MVHCSVAAILMRASMLLYPAPFTPSYFAVSPHLLFRPRLACLLLAFSCSPRSPG